MGKKIAENPFGMRALCQKKGVAKQLLFGAIMMGLGAQPAMAKPGDVVGKIKFTVSVIGRHYEPLPDGSRDVMKNRLFEAIGELMEMKYPGSNIVQIYTVNCSAKTTVKDKGVYRGVNATEGGDGSSTAAYTLTGNKETTGCQAHIELNPVKKEAKFDFSSGTGIMRVSQKINENETNFNIDPLGWLSTKVYNKEFRQVTLKPGSYSHNGFFRVEGGMPNEIPHSYKPRDGEKIDTETTIEWEVIYNDQPEEPAKQPSPKAPQSKRPAPKPKPQIIDIETEQADGNETPSEVIVDEGSETDSTTTLPNGNAGGKPSRPKPPVATPQDMRDSQRDDGGKEPVSGDETQPEEASNTEDGAPSPNQVRGGAFQIPRQEVLERCVTASTNASGEVDPVKVRECYTKNGG